MSRYLSCENCLFVLGNTDLNLGGGSVVSIFTLLQKPARHREHSGNKEIKEICDPVSYVIPSACRDTMEDRLSRKESPSG